MLLSKTVKFYVYEVETGKSSPEQEVGEAAEEFPSTEKIYLTDTYLFSCEATVLGVRLIANESAIVVLDRTIFHSQGGGQPADVGMIRTQDGHIYPIASAHQEGDVVMHVVFHGENLSVSETVTVSIDSSARITHARLHSFGHSLDAAVRKVGLKGLAPLKGYHFRDGPYVEYAGTIEAKDKDTIVQKLNDAVREIVADGMPTTIDYRDGRRMVTVGGEECPCGGTHVSNTSELENITITKIKTKKGNVRISYAMDQ